MSMIHEAWRSTRDLSPLASSSGTFLEKPGHELMALVKGQVSVVGHPFIVGGLPLARNSGPGDRERHRAMRVGARPQRGPVVGRDQNPPAAMPRQGVQQRADDVPVNFFKGLDLGLHFALM